MLQCEKMQFRNAWPCPYQKITDLNLFESEIASENERCAERFTTRIFLLVFVGCFFAITVFVTLSEQNQLVTVSQPNEDDYRVLNEYHNSTLVCPCSQISIPYRKLFNVTFVIHEVCSSDLVSLEWINYLSSFDPMNISNLYNRYFASLDFRVFGATYFGFLQTLCSLTVNHIDNVEDRFMGKELINSNVLSPDIFDQKMADLIETHITSVRNGLTQIYQWIEIINTINLFLTGIQSNFDGILQNNQVSIINTYLFDYIHVDHDGLLHEIGTCSCSTAPHRCISAFFVYLSKSQDYNLSWYLKEIPSMCVPWHGFSWSRIDWLYNQSYIDGIRLSYAIVMTNITAPAITALSSSTDTSFHGQWMADLIAKSFTERILTNNASFSAFYNQCAPQSCSYTNSRRRDLVIVLLLLISINEGLNNTLRLLVPLLSKCILYFHKLWKLDDRPRSEYIYRFFSN